MEELKKITWTLEGHNFQPVNQNLASCSRGSFEKIVTIRPEIRIEA